MNYGRFLELRLRMSSAPCRSQCGRKVWVKSNGDTIETLKVEQIFVDFDSRRMNLVMQLAILFHSDMPLPCRNGTEKIPTFVGKITQEVCLGPQRRLERIELKRGIVPKSFCKFFRPL